MEHVCQECGKAFSRKGNRKRLYCSTECLANARRGAHRPKELVEALAEANRNHPNLGHIVTIPCTFCGKPLKRYRSQLTKSGRAFCNGQEAAKWQHQGVNQADIERQGHSIGPRRDIVVDFQKKEIRNK